MGTGFVTTLKGFLSKHPPLLVFVTCLLLCGLAAIILAFLVGERELPNPDVQTDWNTFLETLAKWDVCRQQHPTKMGMHFTEHATTLGSDEWKSVMVTMAISWKPPWPKSGDVVILGSLHGSQSDKEDNVLHVTMHIPNIVNPNEACSSDSCTKRVFVCLTFTGSLSMLPNTRKPASCSTVGSDSIRKETTFYAVSTNSAELCSEDNLLRMSYTSDPDLTVMLTYRERSLVNIHLMHTGYFILACAFTLFFTILLRDHFKSTGSETKILPEEMQLENAHRQI